MISEKQLAANRRNAKRSTGPRTEEGKATVARNGQTHGLTGQILALTPEERVHYLSFTTSYVASLSPGTFVETEIAESVADSIYRLHRASAVEQNVFALGQVAAESTTGNDEIDVALASAQTFLRESKKILLLSLYEQRLRRKVEKDLAQLKEWKAQRLAERAPAPEEVKPLPKDVNTKGMTCNLASGFPPANGFGFSTAKIGDPVYRKRRPCVVPPLFSTGSPPQNALARAA